MPVKVVIDTNVFISFLLVKNLQIITLLDLIDQKKIIPVYSFDTLCELNMVAKYPKFITKICEEEIQALINKIVGNGFFTIIKSNINLFDDPDDDIFINTAVDGKAEYLISGDKKHVLKKKKYKNIKIVSLNQFLYSLQWKMQKYNSV